MKLLSNIALLGALLVVVAGLEVIAIPLRLFDAALGDRPCTPP